MAGEKKAKSNVSISHGEGVDNATSRVDKQLNQAAVVPPPSGTAGAGTSVAPGLKTADSKATEAPGDSSTVSITALVFPSDDKGSHTRQNVAPEIRLGSTTTHRGSNVSTASAEIIREIERSLVIPEEPEAEAEGDIEGKDTGQAIVEDSSEDESSHHRAVEPKTQDQPAASSELAGTTVED